MRSSRALLAALRSLSDSPRLAFFRRHRLTCTVLLALLLVSPALRVGLVVDDHFHRAALRGSRVFAEFIDSPLDMFRFFDGNPARTMRLVDLGMLPWWTDPAVKAGFWRPLTVLTHWLDYRLWPDSPLLMHLHSIMWFGALLFVVALLYRRYATPAWVAGLATLLYALDDAHGMPVAFLANRNVLPCALFGVLALLAHDRWRRDGWRPGAALGPLCLALSLLSKEAGVATCGYLAAHALFLERGDRWRSALALLPYVLIVVVWRGLWTYLGYGVENVGLYIDPLREPGRYAAAVVERAPLLLLAQWALPPAELAIVLSSGWVRVLWWCAAAFLIVLVVALAPLLRHDRTARFWTVGMTLAVLPCCATFPADRTLFFVGLGAMGLVAQFWHGALGDADWRPARRSWRLIAKPLAFAFVVIHLIIAPVALPYRAANPAGPKMVETLYLRPDFDESVARQTVVLVNPPSVLHIAYFMVEQEARGEPLPLRVRQLASGLQAVTLRRPDDYTLAIRPEKGWQSWTFEYLFRNHQHPMHVGQRVELTGMTADVTELTPDGRPAEARFRFDVPLEDSALRWLVWRAGGFQTFEPPPIGGTLTIDPEVGLF